MVTTSTLGEEMPDEDMPDENPGHELDLVPIFSSTNHDAEMEAMSIHSVLEANGIESVLEAPTMIPSVEFQVQVPRDQVAEAQRILAEASAAGPSAAEEGEAEGEAQAQAGQ